MEGAGSLDTRLLPHGRDRLAHPSSAAAVVVATTVDQLRRTVRGSQLHLDARQDAVFHFFLFLSVVVGVVWIQGPLGVEEHAVVVLNPKPLILFLIQSDKQLAGVDRRFGAVPFDEILEAFGVFEDGADAAEDEPF